MFYSADFDFALANTQREIKFFELNVVFTNNRSHAKVYKMYFGIGNI